MTKTSILLVHIAQ